VVIIGGGDTAADCLGTANRQGATVVHQIDHNPTPPADRDPEANPWPTWPKIHRYSAAHEEGVVEQWASEVVEILGDDEGRVRAVRLHDVERVVVDGRASFVVVP